MRTTITLLSIVFSTISVAQAQNAPISTRIIAIALLNPIDRGFDQDSKSFKSLIGSIPQELTDDGGNKHVINKLSMIVSLDATGTWKGTVQDPTTNLLASVDRSATTLLIHFGGHGAILERSNGSKQFVLSLDPFGTDRLIERDRLLNWMKELQCRTTILVTDTCAGAFKTDRPVAAAGAPEPACIELFLRFPGPVDIRSASDGEYAWSDDGGAVFSRVFYNRLSQPWDPGAVRNWNTMASILEQQTQNEFTRYKALHLQKDDLDARERALLQAQTSQTPDFKF